MDTIISPSIAAETRAELAADSRLIQPAGFLIELSLDWIVLRASENVDDFLGESHVTLIEEPLSRFVQAQGLHDLRNHFARLSGSTGIARAYRVRLTDDRPRLDIAFQVSNGRVLLEAVPSPEHGLGEAIGAVGGLIDGLAAHRGQGLLEAAARRMRALTGSDQCLLMCGNDDGQRSAHSSRGGFGKSSLIPDLPPIIAASSAAPVPIFPPKPADRSIAQALLRSPFADELQHLHDQRIGSAMTVPVNFEGEPVGIFQCAYRAPRQPNFELHAAAELFAQMFALRLKLDHLRG